MKKIPLLALALVVFALASCGGDDGPPDISYGRDICDSCGMVIDDPRFASAYRTPGGEVRKFDDAGSMFEYGTQNGEIEDSTLWVHDYETEDWIAAEEAWYVLGPEVQTPMASGVVAFSDEERARSFAESNGAEVLGWDEMAGRAAQGGLSPVTTIEPGEPGSG